MEDNRDLPYECISDPWPQLRPRLPRHNWPPAATPPTRKTPRGAGSILTTVGPTLEAGRRARPMGTECVRVLRVRGSIGGPGTTDSRSQESTRGPGNVRKIVPFIKSVVIQSKRAPYVHAERPFMKD